jgi:transcriptional regulator with XRE-family HTH domain
MRPFDLSDRKVEGKMAEGGRIRLFRTHTNLNQTQLAKLLGSTSPNPVTTVETGQRRVPRSECKRWAQALGVPEQILFGDCGITLTDNRNDEQVALEVLGAAYKALSPSGRWTLLDGAVDLVRANR